MIKVIKHGYKKLQVICPECGCEFSFLPTDMKHYGNQIDQYEAINCPDCNYEMTWWQGEKSGYSANNDRPPNM